MELRNKTCNWFERLKPEEDKEAEGGGIVGVENQYESGRGILRRAGGGVTTHGQGVVSAGGRGVCALV